jgi:hypothetical protein
VTWLVIFGMSLGLPLGAWLQQRRERRAAEGLRRLQDHRTALWEGARRQLDEGLREAQLSAEADAQVSMRRVRIEAANMCGCADCRSFLERNAAGRN